MAIRGSSALELLELGKSFKQAVEEFLTACEVVRLWNGAGDRWDQFEFCKEMEESIHTSILEPQAAKPEAVQGEPIPNGLAQPTVETLGHHQWRVTTI